MIISNLSNFHKDAKFQKKEKIKEKHENLKIKTKLKLN